MKLERVVVGLMLAGALALRPRVAEAQDVYFKPPADWQFKWGTDTALTASNLESGSTNAANDGSSNFDALWMRLYGKLAYQDKAELVLDFFSSEASTPIVYGLYARLEPKPYLGLRAGLIPLVVGGWQDRAYPSRQPLINQPLISGYLFPIRNDSVPHSVDELLSQRGKGAQARYPNSVGGESTSATLFYEHCWDTGIELFGRAKGLRYRVALMEGAPGSSSKHVRQEKEGLNPEARITYRFGDALRVGGSYAWASYLKEPLAPQLPAGKTPQDYKQELWGADVLFKKGRVEINGEWTKNRYDSPFIAEPLRTQAYYAEAALRLVATVQIAARYSELWNSDVTDASGRKATWDANARRIEAGAVYRFWEDNVAVKAVYQRTLVDLQPQKKEEIYALQLSFHH